MAEKNYLDAEGLKRLVQYINAQYQALYGDNKTPGSILYMIDNALQDGSMTQQEPLYLYGGSASSVL